MVAVPVFNSYRQGSFPKSQPRAVWAYSSAEVRQVSQKLQVLYHTPTVPCLITPLPHHALSHPYRTMPYHTPTVPCLITPLPHHAVSHPYSAMPYHTPIVPCSITPLLRCYCFHFPAVACLIGEGGDGRRAGGGCTHVMHGRSRMTVDPRTPAMPGLSTSSGSHPPGRH